MPQCLANLAATAVHTAEHAGTTMASSASSPGDTAAAAAAASAGLGLVAAPGLAHCLSSSSTPSALHGSSAFSMWCAKGCRCLAAGSIAKLNTAASATGTWGWKREQQQGKAQREPTDRRQG